MHENELVTLKYLVSHAPSLKLFNPNLEITIQSAEGLRCVLLQRGFPITFAFRTLSKSKRVTVRLRRN